MTKTKKFATFPACGGIQDGYASQEVRKVRTPFMEQSMLKDVKDAQRVSRPKSVVNDDQVYVRKGQT